MGERGVTIPAKQPEKFHIQTIETIKLIVTIQIDTQLKKLEKKNLCA